ncbi:GNAT family N-acetyltransferase [Nafulsella turpanensis]|uniref:GNAT family N-acetyltransferase n=1 Tax=Nafulsella turpanensis TaxID=1265690 RepID=UPI000346B367|nr:GNAT family N-acetyltransferase [Nafulsella turpanensis]
MDYLYREATYADFPSMMKVRMAVRENMLSQPGKVQEKDYLEILSSGGKGWVCETGQEMLGFAIADIDRKNIWALFILPDFEQKGIGRHLHMLMLNWCFQQPGVENLWLSTDPGTRAEQFYQKAGWEKKELLENGEQLFEISKNSWVAQWSLNSSI